MHLVRRLPLRRPHRRPSLSSSRSPLPGRLIIATPSACSRIEQKLCRGPNVRIKSLSKAMLYLPPGPVAVGGSLSSNLGLVVEEERYVAATQTPLVRPSPLAFASSATRAHRSMLRFCAGCCAVSRPEHRHLHQSTHDPDPRRWEGRELCRPDGLPRAASRRPLLVSVLHE